MTFSLAQNPFKIEDKEPSVHLIPFGILVPCLALFITKWSSVVFIYTTGSDDMECAMPGAWDEPNDSSNKRLRIYCKQHLFHVSSLVLWALRKMFLKQHI